MKLTEDQERRLAQAIRDFQNDPVIFARVFLNHHLPIQKTPEFHKEIYRALLGDDLRLLVIAPRSFAKSTIVSFIWPLFLALTGRAKKIFIVSATGALASEWLRKIKSELETNEELRAIFGDQVSDKWTEDHIILRNGAEIVSKGQGFQIRGFRPDYVVVDDIEDDELVRSEDQRKKLLQWFDSALTNTLEKDSKMVVIGTILHPLSILKGLQRREGWRTLFYKALPTETTSLWFDKWPVEALLARKAEIGTRAFLAEFQNSPISLEVPIVREENLMTCDYARPSVIIKEIIAVDPASSKKDWADYSGIVCVGLTATGFYRIRFVRQARLSPGELVSEIFKVSEQFPKARIVIEEQALEKALQDAIRKEGREKSKAIPIAGVKADKDKVRRLERVSHLFEQKLVFFETKDGTLDEDSQALWDELVVFPEGDHDDLVDALAYALAELRYGHAAILHEKKELPFATVPTARATDSFVPKVAILQSREG